MDAPINKYSQWLVYLALLVSFFAVLFGLASHWSHNSQFLNNGDVVGDAYIVHTFLYNHDKFQNWTLTNAFFLFPDITILFLISFFVKTISNVFPIYALIQITLTFSFMTYLIRQISTNKKVGLRLGFIAGFSLLLLVIALNPYFEYGSYDYLVPLLLPSFHFGSFLISILCIALTLKIIKKPKISLLTLLSFLVIITAVSDPLILYYFTFPVMAAIFCWFLCGHINKKLCFSLLSWFTGMTIIWFVIYKFAPLPFDKIPLHLTFPFAHLNVLVNTAKDFLSINSNVYVGIAWLIFVIGAPISLIKSYIDQKLQLKDFFMLFELLMLVLSALAILTTVVGFAPQDGALLPLRYFIPFILSPVFLGLPVLIYKHCSTYISLENNWLYLIILIFISFMALHHKRSIEWNNLVSYYPKNVECFDKVVAKYQLQNGITPIWGYQNTYNAFNRSGTHLVLVNMANLKPHLWFSTKLLYTYHNFDYVLLQDNNKKQLNKNLMLMKQHFGKPTAKVVCHGNGIYTTEYIYIYKNSPLNKLSFEKYYEWAQ